MVAPIDYSLNVKSPFEAAVQGYGIGANMAQMQAQREATMAQRDAMQAKADAERAEAQRQAEARDATKALFSNPNPTAQDFVRVASMLPEKEAASMRANWDLMNKDKQENTLKFSGQVLSAFNSGSPQVGVQLLKDRAEAERNAGQEDQAKAYDTWAQIAEANPQAAMKSMGIMVAQVPGGDKVIESVTKIGQESRAEAKAPAELKEAIAKADKAATAAKFAEAEIVMNLEKAGWDIKKLQSEIGISERNSRIAAARLDIERESNNIKRKELEMKLGDMVRKRDDEVRTKVSEATEAVNGIDNTRTLISSLMGDEDTLRAATGASAFRGWIPGTKARTAAGQLDQLGNSIAATKMGLLKGATSDKDIAFLKSIDANLDRFQSEDALIKEIKRIDQGLFEMRSRTTSKFGMPDIAPSKGNEKAANKAPANLTTDDILKELGVM